MIGVNTMQFNKQLKENKMKKLFLNLKQSSELQKLGFNEPCFGRYDGKGDNKGKLWYEMPNSGQDTIPVGDVLAPTFSQAMKWFDDNTELKGFVCPSIKEEHFDWLIRIDWEEEIECEEAYSSRQEAESACLDKLIELAKTK